LELGGREPGNGDFEEKRRKGGFLRLNACLILSFFLAGNIRGGDSYDLALLRY
jgi:hypothetical protein